MPSVLAQGNSTCYEPPAINFHLGETPPREPQGGGEHTERAALFCFNTNGNRSSRMPAPRWTKARLERTAELVLHRLPLTLAAILLLAAIAINFANVVARYLLLSSIYWADEAMVYLVIWSVFLAAIAVTYDGSQLTMDLFSTRLPPRWQRALDGAIAATCAVTFAFMAWQAMIVVATLMRNDQRSIALDIPVAIAHAALLVGFAFSVLVVAARVALGHRIIKPMSPDDVTSAI
jgi:TRAP-type C4-dicarboxylate transport system permease small subunit